MGPPLRVLALYTQLHRHRDHGKARLERRIAAAGVGMTAVAGEPVEERAEPVAAGDRSGGDRPILLEEPAAEGEALGRSALEAAERALEDEPRRGGVFCRRRPGCERQNGKAHENDRRADGLSPLKRHRSTLF